MENVMKKEIGEEFYICEKCTYERGFHVSLVRKDTHHEIVPICPNCGQRYNVGWKLTLTQEP